MTHSGCDEVDGHFARTGLRQLEVLDSERLVGGVQYRSSDLHALIMSRPDPRSAMWYGMTARRRLRSKFGPAGSRPAGMLTGPGRVLS